MADLPSESALPAPGRRVGAAGLWGRVRACAGMSAAGPGTGRAAAPLSAVVATALRSGVVAAAGASGVGK